jgi:hypothetical protein
MKKLLFTFFCFYGLLSNAQPNRILFQYDIAGNQIERKLCLNCLQSRNSNTNETQTEDITQLEDEDLLKFSENDVISYYPNPVREELYLKWELIDNDLVSSIDVYSITGQLVKTYKNLEKENNTILYFGGYPANTYLVMLNYKSGEQKSITIIKNQ